jgi:hypothetical protein
MLLKFASSTSRNGSGLLKPALLNRTSSRPKLSTTALIAALTWPRSPTSACTLIAPAAPSPFKVSATAFALSPLRSAMAIAAPSEARRRAMPSPMPCAPPVIMTTVFSSLAIVFVLLMRRCGASLQRPPQAPTPTSAGRRSYGRRPISRSQTWLRLRSAPRSQAGGGRGGDRARFRSCRGPARTGPRRCRLRSVRADGRQRSDPERVRFV